MVRVTPDLAAIEAVAREFARERIDILAVCGGDGSHFRTLSAMRRAYGGKVRGGPEHVLAHVAHVYRHGRTHDIVERHLLVVNDEHAGFVIGCGVIVNYLRLYYSERKPGPVTAVRLLARLVGSACAGTPLVRGVFRRVEADIDCDEERVPFRTFSVVLAGTITHVALGFKPMYLAARKRHHFHLLAGPIGPLRLTRKIVRFHKGMPLEEPEFYDNLARTAVVHFATPTSFMMDGDILGERIRTGQVLSMIRG